MPSKGWVMNELDIKFTNDFAEAQRLRDQGYEPIECAFGQHGSVMGPLNMDHHGTESHREGVAIRACRDHFGARSEDPRFVVTGAPDADAVLAIVALAGLVPEVAIDPTFYTLVNRFDIDPIGIELFDEERGVELAQFNQLQGLRQSEAGFRRGIEAMMHILTHGVAEDEKERMVRADDARKRKALEGIHGVLDSRGYALALPESPLGSVRRGEAIELDQARIVVTRSPVWGFDVWYRVAPIVVSYSDRLEKFTVGVADTETARLIFGEKGLNVVWPELGPGWGGRESVGGSPRGANYSFEQVDEVTDAIVRHLRRR